MLQNPCFLLGSAANDKGCWHLAPSYGCPSQIFLKCCFCQLCKLGFLCYVIIINLRRLFWEKKNHIFSKNSFFFHQFFEVKNLWIFPKKKESKFTQKLHQKKNRFVQNFLKKKICQVAKFAWKKTTNLLTQNNYKSLGNCYNANNFIYLKIWS